MNEFDKFLCDHREETASDDELSRVARHDGHGFDPSQSLFVQVRLGLALSRVKQVVACLV